MERETATQLLNKLVDDHILLAKEEVEREIEVAVDGQMAEMKKWLLGMMDDVIGTGAAPGQEAILEILDRAVNEEEFAREIEADCSKALQGYALSPAEQLAISVGDVRQITLWLGELEPRQRQWLCLRQEKALDMSRNDVLLKGLELVENYYMLGLDQLPLSVELRSMIEEAKEQAERLKYFTKTQETIRQKVEELSQIDQIIDKYGADRGSLIQILIDIQEQNHWLPKTALKWVSERLEVPLAQIYQVITFYKAFRLTPGGRHQVSVCMGTACQVRGSQRLLDRSVDVFKVNPGETDSEQKFTMSTVNCLGCCASGPVVVVDEDYFSSPSQDELVEIAAKYQ